MKRYPCNGNFTSLVHSFAPVEKPAEAVENSVRVLIVDDLRMNRTVLELIFSKLGASTRSAGSGVEALEILKKVPVDLVLTDLRMPGMNGLELAREIRNHTEYRGLTLALLSAEQGAGTEFDLSVIDRVVEKPPTREKLRRLLESLPDHTKTGV